MVPAIVTRFAPSPTGALHPGNARRHGNGLRIGVTDADGARHQLLAVAAQRELPVIVFERQRPTLEDVFLRLVGRTGTGAGR